MTNYPALIGEQGNAPHNLAQCHLEVLVFEMLVTDVLKTAVRVQEASEGKKDSARR